MMKKNKAFSATRSNPLTASLFGAKITFHIFHNNTYPSKLKFKGGLDVIKGMLPVNFSCVDLRVIKSVMKPIKKDLILYR